MIEEEIEVLDYNDTNPEKKSHVPKKRTIIVIIIVLLCLVLISMIVKYIANISKPSFENAFFIKDANNNYALFDDKGKKLTDFIYTEVSPFINDSAYVADKDLNYGIISSKGKMIVDYNEYQLITRKGSFYKAQLVSKNILLSSAGESICDITDSEVLLYDENDIVIISEDDKYKVINVQGEVIFDFPIVENVKKPVVDGKDGYIIVYYNAINYIVDLENTKVVKKIEEEQRYCIYDVSSKNRDNIIISTCTLDPNDQIKYNYKYLEKDNIIIEKDSNKLAAMNFSGNNIIYVTEKNSIILNKDGSEALNVTGVQYVDQNNYARYNELAKQVNIFTNGEISTKAYCNHLASGYMEQGIYLFSKCTIKDNDGSFAYYDVSGKRIGTGYKKGYPLDSNNRAIVSSDDENYYLMNEKGKKVSSVYRSIEKAEDLYIGISAKNKVTLFDKNNKVKLTADSYVPKNFDNYTMLLFKKGNSYIIYDIKARKKVASVSEYPLLEDNYFTISSGKQTRYYSYTTGKKFYEI